MIQELTYWISNNYIEIIASTLGLTSVYFGIKEKSVFWLFALTNAAFFVYIYFDKKVYALMILQFYYISLSIYGFFYWLKGSKKDDKKAKLPIIRLSKKRAFIGGIAFVIIYFTIVSILKHFTDSEIPFADAGITTISIFASFMMTRKYLEHWLLWFVSDIISITIFTEKQMYATAFMYLVLFFSAFLGFFKWRKEYSKQQCQ